MQEHVVSGSRIRFSYHLILVACFVLSILSLEAIALSGRQLTGDEPHYLIITQSIVEDFDIELYNNYAAEGRFDAHAVIGRNGLWYPGHEIALPIIMAPMYRVGGLTGIFFTLGTIYIILSLLIWRFCHNVGISKQWATIAVAAVISAPPLLLYSLQLFPEILGATLIIAALAALYSKKPMTVVQVVALGALIGSLPWVNGRYISAAVILAGLYLGTRRIHGRQRVVVFCTAWGVLVLGKLGYNLLLFGRISGPQSYDRIDVAGYIGVLLDYQHGLFTQAPFWIAGIAGTIVLARRRPDVALGIALVGVAYYIPVGAWYIWWGGVGPQPARLLVGVLPVAAPGIAELLSTSNAIGKACIAALWLGSGIPTFSYLYRQNAYAGAFGQTMHDLGLGRIAELAPDFVDVLQPQTVVLPARRWIDSASVGILAFSLVIIALVRTARAPNKMATPMKDCAC